jgi:hypothetical protein
MPERLWSKIDRYAVNIDLRGVQHFAWSAGVMKEIQPSRRYNRQPVFLWFDSGQPTDPVIVLIIRVSLYYIFIFQD